MTSEARKGVFEGSGSGAGFQSRGGIHGDEAAVVQKGNAIGEELDFGQRVRRKEKSSALAAEDFGLQKASKIGGRESIEAARGFIKQDNLRLVKKRTKKTKALDGAARKRADLAVKKLSHVKLFGDNGNAIFQARIGEMVEPAEKTEIFARGEAGIET